MALKGDRNIQDWNISLINNDVAERGVFMCYSTSGSGIALGNNAGYCQLAAAVSGLKPAGLLTADFVNIDTTLFHVNFHKEQYQVGQKAPLATRGWVVTNKYTGSPTVGAVAYLGDAGKVQPTQGAGGVVHTPPVGRFESIPDEDAYVKVSFNLPMVAGYTVFNATSGSVLY